MSFSSGLNPNVVKTALDDVFDQTFSGKSHPNHATAEDGMVFNQDTADSSAVIMELFKGVGSWETRAEEQDVPAGEPRIDNQKTFTVTNYSKSVDIPKNFFDDNKHGSYEKMVKNFARRAQTTRDKNAFAIFRNGFTTATTADGVALFSDSHTALSGDTVDNLAAASTMSPTTIATMLNQLYEMKAQDGEIDGHIGRVLLVPGALWKSAYEITKSELIADSADNAINAYSSTYGLTLKTSPYLGAAAGGSDTAYFILSDTHSVNRWVRQAVQTDLVDYKFQRNNNYIYKGEYREVVGAMSYEGVVGSAGA